MATSHSSSTFSQLWQRQTIHASSSQLQTEASSLPSLIHHQTTLVLLCDVWKYKNYELNAFALYSDSKKREQHAVIPVHNSSHPQSSPSSAARSRTASTTTPMKHTGKSSSPTTTQASSRQASPTRRSTRRLRSLASLSTCSLMRWPSALQRAQRLVSSLLRVHSRASLAALFGTRRLSLSLSASRRRTPSSEGALSVGCCGSLTDLYAEPTGTDV